MDEIKKLIEQMQRYTMQEDPSTHRYQYDICRNLDKLLGLISKLNNPGAQMSVEDIVAYVSNPANSTKAKLFVVETMMNGGQNG